MLEFLRRHWHSVRATPLILGLVWIGLSAFFFPSRPDFHPAPKPGFTAPPLTLDTLNGSPLDLEQIHSQVIVLNFWASWCPPCRAEMPVFEKLSREFDPAKVHFIGINTTYQDDITQMQQFVRDNDLTFTIALDIESQSSQTYQIQALPTTFLLDQRKVIRAMVLGGPVSEAWLRAEIHRILQSPR